MGTSRWRDPVASTMLSATTVSSPFDEVTCRVPDRTRRAWPSSTVTPAPFSSVLTERVSLERTSFLRA